MFGLPRSTLRQQVRATVRAALAGTFKRGPVRRDRAGLGRDYRAATRAR